MFFVDYYSQAYPGVIIRVILRRKVSFHLVQTYIPSSIFVCLAWLSVFVPPEQVPGNMNCQDLSVFCKYDFYWQLVLSKIVRPMII